MKYDTYNWIKIIKKGQHCFNIGDYVIIKDLDNNEPDPYYLCLSLQCDEILQTVYEDECEKVECYYQDGLCSDDLIPVHDFHNFLCSNCHKHYEYDSNERLDHDNLDWMNNM